MELTRKVKIILAASTSARVRRHYANKYRFVYLLKVLRRYFPEIHHVSAVHGQETIFVHVNDNIISPEILNTGAFEKERLLAACELCRGLGLPLGGHFVDVGANIGSSTICALKSGHFGAALAFEPEPENARLLRANLAVNALQNKAVLVEAAISDAEGSVSMALAPNNPGDHRVLRGEASQALRATSRLRINVKAVTLDGGIAEAGVDPQQISLVKTDTQGYEGHVLAGASSIVTRKVPIMLEFWPEGLKQTGGLEPLFNVIESKYRWLFDLSERSFTTRRPANAIRALASEIKSAQTDLLVVA
jgi:FkbM family methyltransferase